MNNLIKEQLASGDLFSVDLSILLLGYMEAFLEEKKKTNILSNMLKNDFTSDIKNFSNIYSVDTYTYSSKKVIVNIKDKFDYKKIKMSVEQNGRNFIFNIDYGEECYFESLKYSLPVFNKTITTNLENKYFSQSLFEFKVTQHAFIHYSLKEDFNKKVKENFMSVNEKDSSINYLKDYLKDNQFLTKEFFEILELKYDNTLPMIRKYIESCFLDKSNLNNYSLFVDYLKKFNNVVKLEEQNKSEIYNRRKI